MVKGEIIFKILNVMAETTIDTIDLFTAFLNAGYGASYGKLEYEFQKIQRDKLKGHLQKNLVIKAKQNYHKLVYKLKRDNLIKEEFHDGKKLFSITKKGQIKLESLKNKLSKRLPFFNYPKNKINKLIIVTFDIPEKEKRKREWFRECLKNLDFQMVQKSVWLGKIKIPIELLEDLNRLNMINFVEIFEISKSGSLKKIA